VSCLCTGNERRIGVIQNGDGSEFCQSVDFPAASHAGDKDSALLGEPPFDCQPLPGLQTQKVVLLARINCRAVVIEIGGVQQILVVKQTQPNASLPARTLW
jgi:hypothetical protein